MLFLLIINKIMADLLLTVRISISYIWAQSSHKQFTFQIKIMSDRNFFKIHINHIVFFFCAFKLDNIN